MSDTVLRLEAAYSTQRVADLSGLSYRQLDYYDRLGLLRPTKRSANGSGSRRSWSDGDVVRALLVSALRDLNASTDAITALLGQLDENPAEWPPYLMVDPAGRLLDVPPSSPAYWVVNTRRLLERPRPRHAA